jgi:hypothetical protein
MFVMGPCPRNRFRLSHWPPGSCGVDDSLGPQRAQAWPEIPIRIPNQDIQILARQSPFMKRFGVQASARICGGGASNGTAQAKDLIPNGLDAVANLRCPASGGNGRTLRRRSDRVSLLLSPIATGPIHQFHF